MNEYWLLAFVITPALVATLGWSAALLHNWDLDRRRAARERAKREA